jgi:hypothetical protein
VAHVADAISPLDRLLRACARLQLDDSGRSRLRELAAAGADLAVLPYRAEDHGLTPLVRRHLRAAGVDLPELASQQLTAMTVRHRDAGLVQTAALFDIVDVLQDASIRHVVLKGAVLAHDVYPQPEFRPRRDIDILVDAKEGAATVAALRAIGFAAHDGQPHRASHHHLPPLEREQAGYRVSVEIHVDAISRDQPGSLTLRSLSQPVRELTVGGRRLAAFGHADMLRHLAAHVLQPRAQTRLLGIVDVVEYAARYAGEVDWERLGRSDPRTVNVISLMDYVTPLPEVLGFLRPPAATAPSGTGIGFPPLSTIAYRRGRLLPSIRQLTRPSEWWLHAYFGIPAGRSLWPVRWLRHPWRLARWGWRRVPDA